MIAIIVAMSKELELLLGKIKDVSTIELNGYTFYSGTMGDKPVVAMQCGIGKVNAAIGTLTLIDHFHPDWVINSGIAGGTGQGAAILDVVIANRIAYHDVWCGDGMPWGQVQGCPRFYEPPIDVKGIADQLGVKSGLIASGDIFVSREEDVKRILGLYPDAKAVDMESAAIAQTCYLKGVPMIAVRVVSDTPGQADNISQYANFWQAAPATTFSVVAQLVAALR